MDRRVLILALDGLEYDLVIRWRLRNLMQVRYGVFKSDISPHFKKPHTPMLWASFITGKDPKEHGVDEWWRWNPLLEKIRWLPPFKWIKGKRRLLEKLGIKPKPSLKTLNIETIFDIVKPSIAIDVPTWSMDVSKRFRMIESIMKKNVDALIENVWKRHREKVEELYNSLDKEWRLLMVWFDIADILGHVCISMCRPQLLKCYLELDRLVKNLRDRLDSDTFILVVSDHGMKPMPDGTGDHSEYGFWSINRDYSWFNPQRITDFYHLILRVLSVQK